MISHTFKEKERRTTILYLSLYKLGKDIFYCVSNSQFHSKAIFCAMKQWMDYFKRGVNVEVHFFRLDTNTNVIDKKS